MPYIDKKNRTKFIREISILAETIKSKGEMNYVICELIGQWIIENKLFSYEGISNAIGAVHDAEIELNRRILAPFEVGKMIDNEDLRSFCKILDGHQFITGRKTDKSNKFIPKRKFIYNL